MNARTATRVLPIAITALLLFGGIAAVVSVAHPTTDASSKAAAEVSGAYPFAIGGPAPTSGPTTCPGSTAYTTAQIVILPNGSVFPTGAPVAKTGSFYQLQDPVHASLLVRASSVTVDGSGCTITYTKVGGFGNDTGVEVRNGTNVTLEYFVVTGTYDDGLFVNGSSAVTVYNSSAQSAVTNGLSAFESQNVNFTKNNVSNSEDGIYFEKVVDGLAEDNQAFGTTDTPLYSDVTTDVAYVDNYAPRAAQYGAYLYYDDATVFTGNNLSHVAAGEYGLYMDGSSNDLIRGNNLSGAEKYGAYVSESFGPDSIVGNDFTGGIPYGVYAEDTYYGGVLSILDNDFENTTGYGLYLYEAGPVNATGNDFSLNQTGESTYGVYTYYEYGTTTILDNNFTGGFEYGVYLYSEGSSFTVSNNNLANTTADAVYLYEAYAVGITDNDLAVNKTVTSYGVYVEYDYGGAAQIYGNNLTGGWEYGIYLEYVYGSFDVDHNDLVGYTDVGVEIYESYAPILISNNDLAANATTALDDVYGIYQTYDLNAALTISGNNLTNVYYGFYGDYAIYGNLTIDGNRMLNVSDAGVYYDTDMYGYGSVSGNNFSAAPGDTTYGFYVDYVYGSESFTGNTIVGAEYGILTYGASGSIRVLNNVIKNPTDYGVYVEDASSGLSVTKNIVSGNDSTISAGAEGIYVDDPGGGVASSIDNNTISGGLGYGVYLEYGYSPVNTVNGNSVTGTLDAGVYLSETYSPTWVVGNTISTARGYGIEAYDPANLTIEGNLLQHTNVSINVTDAYAPLWIEDNNATGSNISLELFTYYFDAVALVEANDFSHSKAAYVNETLGGFIGNNFLGTPDLTLAKDTITAFYHNDVVTGSGAKLNLTGTVPMPGVFNAPLPVGGNYWTGYTPTSCTNDICTPEYPVPSLSGLSGYDDLYPLGKAWTNYAITFAETGLPSGTAWSVTVGTTTLREVAPSSVEFFPQNAQPETYPYKIPGVGPYSVVNPTSGSFAASGSAQTISVTFSAPEYAVNFSESGLPAGTVWYVNSTGSPSFPSGAFTVSVSGTQTFLLGNLTNGTYGYTVALNRTGYLTAGPESGTFTMSGKAVSVSYAYSAKTYSVTFSETGLPTGSSWTVTVAGTPYTSTSSTIVVALANGSHSYTVTGPSGYTMTPSSNLVSVAGTSVTVYLAATSSSSGGGVSNDLFYGVLGALIAALALAILGWVLFLRKRSGGASSGGPSSGGPRPWEEGPVGSPPPPPPPPPGS